MRINQLLAYSLAMIAAGDEHFGPAAERRRHHRPSKPRSATRIYNPLTYRSGDPAVAAFWQAKRRERKKREWIRQQKWAGLKPVVAR